MPILFCVAALVTLIALGMAIYACHLGNQIKTLKKESEKYKQLRIKTIQVPMDTICVEKIVDEKMRAEMGNENYMEFLQKQVWWDMEKALRIKERLEVGAMGTTVRYELTLRLDQIETRRKEK